MSVFSFNSLKISRSLELENSIKYGRFFPSTFSKENEAKLCAQSGDCFCYAASRKNWMSRQCNERICKLFLMVNDEEVATCEKLIQSKSNKPPVLRENFWIYFFSSFFKNFELQKLCLFWSSLETICNKLIAFEFFISSKLRIKIDFIVPEVTNLN